jgi:hypothetical protein
MVWWDSVWDEPLLYNKGDNGWWTVCIHISRVMQCPWFGSLTSSRVSKWLVDLGNKTGVLHSHGVVISLSSSSLPSLYPETRFLCESYLIQCNLRKEWRKNYHRSRIWCTITSKSRNRHSEISTGWEKRKKLRWENTLSQPYQFYSPFKLHKGNGDSVISFLLDQDLSDHALTDAHIIID